MVYGTAKAAVIRLTQHVATQHGAQHVRCSPVVPSATVTPAVGDDLSEESIRSHGSLPSIGDPAG